MDHGRKLGQNLNLAFLSLRKDKLSEDVELPLIRDFKFIYL